MSEARADERRNGTAWRSLVQWGLILVALLALWWVLPVEAWITAFRDWAKDAGALGWALFVAGYAVATVLLFPGSVLTIAAGVAYGLWGFPIVLVGATIGASLAFLAGRTFARERVQRAIAERPKFQAVDRAVEEEGWKIVGLLRLSPLVPFNLQNYFFGTTSVGFVQYAIATFFGIMPGTLLYVWLGSIGGAAGAEGSQGSTVKYIFFAVGIIATAVVTWLVAKKARAKLREHGLKEGG